VKPLNQAEQERVAEQREYVLRELPNAIPSIRALHQAGLIDGWRSIIYIGPPRELPNASAGPFMRGDEMIAKE